MDAFKIKVGNKILDYRKPEKLNLTEVKKYFSKKYTVRNISYGSRHVIGDLESHNRILFLKLSTTLGISAVGQIEYKFNEIYNDQVSRKDSLFCVPRNFESGFYNNLFYIISEKIEGQLLSNVKPDPANNVLPANIDRIIEFASLIQSLKFKTPINDFFDRTDYQKAFMEKTESHFNGIAHDVVNKYGLVDVLGYVRQNTISLNKSPRHGDFTPWHIFLTSKNKLVLVDAEHAMANAVENYDICYFIQRVFSVLHRKDLAMSIFNKLINQSKNTEKLKVVLAARAIGGFLDESFSDKPDYFQAKKFMDWVLSL